MRNSPQKLSSPRLAFEESGCTVFGSGQSVFVPNHLVSIFLMVSSSVTSNIALETSGTRGESLGKTYKYIIKLLTSRDKN